VGQNKGIIQSEADWQGKKEDNGEGNDKPLRRFGGEERSAKKT